MGSPKSKPEEKDLSTGSLFGTCKEHQQGKNKIRQRKKDSEERVYDEVSDHCEKLRLKSFRKWSKYTPRNYQGFLAQKYTSWQEEVDREHRSEGCKQGGDNITIVTGPQSVRRNPSGRVDRGGLEPWL